MKVNRVALLVVPVVLLVSLPSAAQFKSRWPAGTKEAAIDGCRESILQQTEQDFLKRSNLKELPPDLREKLVHAIEPFLAVCDCAINHIEREWSFEYFSSHRSEMLAELNKLTVGDCAPAINARPGKEPVSLSWSGESKT
jgi:hypothetical protein